jgi:hypothetical protein
MHAVDRTECEAILEKALSEFAILKRTRRGISKESFTRQKRQLSRRLLYDLCQSLKGLEYKEKAYCCVHDQECLIHPRSSDDLKDSVWVEGGGNCCTAWSQIGGRDGWLHSSALPCLVWVYSTKYYEPDKLLQECSPGFDEIPLISIMSILHCSNGHY